MSNLNNATPEDNIIDSEFLGEMVSNTIDAGFEEMLPFIKELFDKRYVSTMISGDYEEAKSYFTGLADDDIRKEIKNIFEFYTEMLDDWVDEATDEGFWDEDEMETPAVSAKIGRNDPCPCGSGKKYKKCCLNKLPV